MVVAAVNEKCRSIKLGEVICLIARLQQRYVGEKERLTQQCPFVSCVLCRFKFEVRTSTWRLKIFFYELSRSLEAGKIQTTGSTW